MMNPEEITKLKKAGEIVKQTKAFAREFIKQGQPLLEIAERIEAKIQELGGQPAFPVTLSINEVAAHSTPSYNDETLSYGLLKVDCGCHIDGFIADSAFSLNLDNSEEHKKLIDTAEAALKNAIKVTKIGAQLNEIGKAVEETAKENGLQPIANLSGHSLSQNEVHAGISIPNYNNSQTTELVEGTYAIEPFITSGVGKVRDGKPSGIYLLEAEGQVRDAFAREVLSYIKENYGSLEFCSRWLVKKFGTRALLALKRIEDADIIHHYKQLIEVSKKPVAQAEHTIILTENEKIITT